MNIDLLPFSAFSLESPPSAVRTSGKSPTLTLQVALEPLPSAHGAAMGGSVQVGADGLGPGPLRATVVPGNSQALTLTF